MRTAKKNAILIAVILIAVGLFISFGSFLAMGFDINKMNTMDFVTNTYSVDEKFSNISVKGAECDVRLVPSEDAACRVVCNEGDKISHSVTVEDDTLVIERKDNREWYEHIGIYWGGMEIVVYLPQDEYEAIHVLSVSGDIDIPKEFSFSEAKIDNTSGDVSFSAPVKNELSVKTVSGDMELTNIECQSVTATSTSGEIVFSKVTAQENIHIESVSGDVELLKCDAGSIWIKTTSGEVSGTLCTEKKFIVDTVSGDVDVPKSTYGGKCEIKTTSGDVEFTIE